MAFLCFLDVDLTTQRHILLWIYFNVDILKNSSYIQIHGKSYLNSTIALAVLLKEITHYVLKSFYNVGYLLLEYFLSYVLVFQVL